MTLDIPQLRQTCRDPAFCNSVTPTLLSEIVDALLDLPTNSKKLKDDLFATISNILLINRHLHSSFFTPNYAIPSLLYLNDYLSLPETETDRNDPGYYRGLVAVYRLIFLILLGEEDLQLELVVRTCNTLKAGLELCISRIGRFKEDTFFNMVLVEILKGLSTIYHNYLHVFKKIRVDEYIFLLSKIELTKHNVMTKYIVNVLVMVFTINVDNGLYNCIDAYTIEDAAVFFNCLLKLMLYKLSNFNQCPDVEVDDLTNMYLLVNHLCTLLCRSEREYSSLKNLLLDLILPRKGYSADIYMESLKLISTTDDEITDDSKITLFKNIFLQCMYNLCLVKEECVVTFLELVGYVLAKTFIELNNIEIPSNINLEDYLKPKYGDKDFNFELNNINVAWDSILHSHQAEPNLDMSEDEKEREAEKLFVLFDRMEKTGVFENFKNPVREWQQLGKFEDIN